jgi:putative nucleotidyltransferase with HDIG domain
LPALYTDIMRCLQSPNASLEDVGELIARDLGMTAKVLKLVNSAFFGLPRQIASPSEAVLYLGMENVKSLVLAAQTFGQFQEINVPGFDAAALWQHSLEVATAAQKIARQQHAKSIVTEQAFVAGLLHDVGKLILAINLRDQYTAIAPGEPSADRRVWMIEREILGASHADVGAYLLGLWGLPPPVVEAIALHHQPVPNEEAEFTPLTAVYVANILLTPGDASRLDFNYLQQLGLLPALPEWQAIVGETTPAQETKS